MPVVRLILVFTMLAAFVLGLAYLFTRDKRYIALFKQMLSYVLGFFVLLAVLYLMMRVLHL